MFELKRCYTRAQIHDLVGGGIQDYLPHKDGKIVCGCFRTDTNPNAPDVILPGTGPEIQKWARVFREQKYPVPVFIKRGSNAWEYVGDYQVDRWTDNAPEFAQDARLAGRTDVTSMMVLKNTEDGRSGA